jgi:hypothetical protein
VSQASINAAHDEEFLDLLVRSGCQGVLIGFESLDPANLAAMNKTFNTARGGYAVALANLRRHRLRVYGTFVFGYDGDTAASFAPRSTSPASTRCTSPPSTTSRRSRAPRFTAGWRPRAGCATRPGGSTTAYRYNQIPFHPRGLSPAELQAGCLAARRAVLFLAEHPAARLRPREPGDAFMWRNFYLINALHRADVTLRDGFPLGDEAWQGTLLPAQ